MVAGVGLLLFLGLSATGYIVTSKRSELDKKISIAAKEIKSANAAEITPSRSSNEELEKELNRYAKAVGSLGPPNLPPPRWSPPRPRHSRMN